MGISEAMRFAFCILALYAFSAFAAEEMTEDDPGKFASKEQTGFSTLATASDRAPQRGWHDHDDIRELGDSVDESEGAAAHESRNAAPPNRKVQKDLTAAQNAKVAKDFAHIDADGDKKLSLDEILADMNKGADKRAQSHNRDVAKDYLAMLDKNQDKMLTLKEYSAPQSLMDSQEEKPEESGRDWDAHGSFVAGSVGRLGTVQTPREYAATP